MRTARALTDNSGTVLPTGVIANGQFLKRDGNTIVSATPPSGGTPPTGTGFRHITSGVEDGAAQLVSNNDVAAGAGIVESKLALNNATHSNSLDHNGGTQDTAISARVQVAGQIGGTAASPDIRGLRETTGPTLLTLGSIADGEFLKRVGSTVVSSVPTAAPSPDGFAFAWFM